MRRPEVGGVSDRDARTTREPDERQHQVQPIGRRQLDLEPLDAPQFGHGPDKGARIQSAWTRANRVFLFWAAFILTRPLGATIGDFFDKPIANGGLDVSRPIASLVLTVAIVALISLLPQRPGEHPAAERAG